MLNGHGDDLYQSGNQIKANFSTNVWYDGDSDIIRSVLKTQLDTIFHYPEPAPNHSSTKWQPSME